MVSMESTFFDRAQFALNASSSNGERLIDTVRCAVLLSAYTYTSGRFHEVSFGYQCNIVLTAKLFARVSIG
jgi:hypothetical protein